MLRLNQNYVFVSYNNKNENSSAEIIKDGNDNIIDEFELDAENIEHISVSNRFYPSNNTYDVSSIDSFFNF